MTDMTANAKMFAATIVDPTGVPARLETRIVRMSVLFPEPFSPMIHRYAPAGTEELRSRSSSLPS